MARGPWIKLGMSRQTSFSAQKLGGSADPIRLASRSRFLQLPLPYLPFIGMVASAIRLLDGVVWQQAKYEMAAPFRGKREALQSRDTHQAVALLNAQSPFSEQSGFPTKFSIFESLLRGVLSGDWRETPK